MRGLAFVMLFAAPAAALDPRDVVVVVNKNVPASREVADHYLAQRKVPRGNVVELDLPGGEDITRADYDARLAAPLRAALKDRKADVRVLLTVYGVPLRVGPKQPTAAEKDEIARLDKEIEAKDGSESRRSDLRRRRGVLAGEQSTASVDSELMLLWWPDYPLARWVANPLYWQVPAEKRDAVPPTLLTARLDGPTPAIAKWLVDDAVAAEADGLTGKAYFDARGIGFDPKKSTGTGYEGYDESFREAAKLLTAGGLDVVLDDKPAVFPPGSCPDAALYAGWYSHAKFVDSFTFARGAVAWHLASSEAVTLRKADSPVWCPNLLKKGAAATIGPVAEPYTVGFPKPAEFFGFLATGRYTLVECYARTVLLASWMGVLVGDPLYTPFRGRPAVAEADVKPSPAGAARR